MGRVNLNTRKIFLILFLIVLGGLFYKALDEGWLDQDPIKQVFKLYFVGSTNQVGQLKGFSAEWMGWEHALCFYSKDHRPLLQAGNYILCSLDRLPDADRPDNCYCCSPDDMSHYETLSSQSLPVDIEQTQECKQQIERVKPLAFISVKQDLLRRFPEESSSLNDRDNLIYLCSTPDTTSATDLKGTWLVVNKRTHKYFFRDWCAR